MKALTLWQPWAHAVCALGKRLENRTWEPYANIIGQRIAIHAASRKPDADEIEATEYLREDGHEVPADLPRGAIVAVARVTGCTRGGALRGAANDEYWWVGPVGWLLDDVVVLPTPVPCKGAQGLWVEGLDHAAKGT